MFVYFSHHLTLPLLGQASDVYRSISLQGDSSTTRKYGGTGLGLSIVKRLVDAHGGRIVLQSIVNQGSTFKITLPVHQPEESTCCSADESKRGSIDMVRPSCSNKTAQRTQLVRIVTKRDTWTASCS